MTGRPAIMSQQWTDEYPDTLTVELRESMLDGEKHVVITGQAVWLNAIQAEEVAAWIGECVAATRTAP